MPSVPCTSHNFDTTVCDVISFVIVNTFLCEKSLSSICMDHDFQLLVVVVDMSWHSLPVFHLFEITYVVGDAQLLVLSLCVSAV